MAHLLKSLSVGRTHKLGHSRCQSTFLHLQADLPKRIIQPVFEDLSPQNSYRLQMILADHIPDLAAPPLLPPCRLACELPIAHHLCYFEPSKRAREMLPDGTNPDQSPGEPFVRRMWAGGRVNWNRQRPLLLDGSRAVCAEFIRSVAVKGEENDEKVFVSVERRVAKTTENEELEMESVASLPSSEQSVQDLHHRVRQRLWRDDECDFGPCSIVEIRNIVFMKARTPKQARVAIEQAKSRGKMLKPQHSPDFSHTITPTAQLLFRFSALTFNAHAIHLDSTYSREVEGHRSTLLHGPLGFTILMTLLHTHLHKHGNNTIKTVEYRNLAPLYCDEPATFCLAQIGKDKWEIWTETPDGGVAIKGTARTEACNVDRANSAQ